MLEVAAVEQQGVALLPEEGGHLVEHAGLRADPVVLDA